MAISIVFETHSLSEDTWVATGWLPTWCIKALVAALSLSCIITQRIPDGRIADRCALGEIQVSARRLAIHLQTHSDVER